METFVRYFHILRLMKPYPRRISTKALLEKLEGVGADYRSLRTIQRDLSRLSEHFQLDGDDKRPQGWCWSKDAAILLPGMDLHTALTFRLMKEFIKPLIPNACLEAAKQHFAAAGKILDNDCEGHHLAWLDKVQIISRGQSLIPPVIVDDVLDTVYNALFSDRRFSATYERREGGELKEYIVNPLGLVFVNKSLYLVCTLREYDDIKQMALHRFTSAKLLDEPAREISGFSLSGYVKDQQAFDFPLTDDTIRLEASFTPAAAKHLMETPLSIDQKIRSKSDSEMIVTATVADTAQLRWWLLGFGDQVEVLKPEKLRKEMASKVKGMAERYLDAPH